MSTADPQAQTEHNELTEQLRGTSLDLPPYFVNMSPIYPGYEELLLRAQTPAA